MVPSLALPGFKVGRSASPWNRFVRLEQAWGPLDYARGLMSWVSDADAAERAILESLAEFRAFELGDTTRDGHTEWFIETGWTWARCSFAYECECEPSDLISGIVVPRRAAA
jgi:hypothetical protein